MRPPSRTVAARRRTLLRAAEDQARRVAEARYFLELIVRRAHRDYGCTVAQLVKATGLAADEVQRIIDANPLRRPS